MPPALKGYVALVASGQVDSAVLCLQLLVLADIGSAGLRKWRDVGLSGSSYQLSIEEK